MIMLSVDHVPFTFHGASVSALYQQDFPLSRLLGQRRRAAEASAVGARAAVSQTSLDVEPDALRAFFMLDERRRVSQVLDEQLSLTGKLVDSALARYSSGRGLQGDALQAQSEQARLRAERLALHAELRAAEAMLHAALAIPQDTPIPPRPTSAARAAGGRSSK
jgi:outer membrane protein TolC